jgi:hypothetical protein
VPLEKFDFHASTLSVEKNFYIGKIFLSLAKYPIQNINSEIRTMAIYFNDFLITVEECIVGIFILI